MTQYLIIDDEPIAHDIIKGYGDMLPHLQLAKHCYDALEALEYLRSQRVDLIFLDLNMPKLKGFDFLKTLPSPPPVIVTTAYQEFALEGYELNVIDYLLKPFSFARFVQAVNKAIPPQAANMTISTPLSSTTSKRVFIRSNKKYLQIDLHTILYLESAGNYAKIVTTSETIKLREKVSDLVTQLDYEDLVQVHKSFVVAKSKINRIEGNRIFIGEEIVPIGKMYRLVFLRDL
ncbi:MAG: LytR/AlgR family response regulator transcription factor [Saprospiraceae bacterium]